MDKYHKRRLLQWVNENWGSDAGVPVNNTPGGPKDTNTMVSNASNNTSNPQSFLNVRNDIAGEELKNKYRGLNSLKELKSLVNDYINDIKVAASDAVSKEAAISSYTKLLDLIQKPEILSAIEHIKQELELKGQGLEHPNN